MAECTLMQAGGGGLDPDELTATAGDVLKGMLAGVKGYDDPVMGTLELTGTAADSQVLSGQTYYNNDAKTKRTGTMTNRGAWNSRIGVNGRVTIPAGYHNGAGYVDQSLTNRGAWTGSVERNTRVPVPEGYHNGSGYVNGPSMTDKGAATYTPSTSNQSIGAGYYLTGAQTILGDANLQPQNIRYGVTIFGVRGTFSGQAITPYVFFDGVNGTVVDNTGGGTYIQTGAYGTSIVKKTYTQTVPHSTYFEFQVRKGAGGMKIDLSGRFNNSVNLTAYRYLKVLLYADLFDSVYGGVITLGISTNSSAVSYQLETSIGGMAGNRTLILDVSNMTGNYFVYLKCDGTADTVITSSSMPAFSVKTITLTDS